MLDNIREFFTNGFDFAWKSIICPKRFKYVDQDRKPKIGTVKGVPYRRKDFEVLNKRENKL